MTDTPQPGDICVVSTGTRWTPVIDWMQFISGRGKSDFDHALMCSRVLADGTVMVVEAMPRGAVEVAWHYHGRPHKWSTGILPPCPGAAVAALRYAGCDERGDKTGPGVGYSYLDYTAIAAHSWHIPAPGLREFIADTEHMICSQLCDQARLDGGSHLFSDGRWPGYVEPMDIAHLLGA